MENDFCDCHNLTKNIASGLHQLDKHLRVKGLKKKEKLEQRRQMEEEEADYFWQRAYDANLN